MAVALAALIMAYETADGEGDALRATLPLLGRSLIERQVAQVRAAGAVHAILLVERVPGDLIAAVDRLRRDGATIELARGMGEAADRVHPDERLLVVADGCLADQRLVEATAHAAPQTLMVLDDRPDAARFERIDAGARWAGLALIDGTMLRETAAMLGDWDPQSTLLRRAVQAGAQRIAVPPASEPQLLTAPAMLASLDRALVDGDARAGGRWPSRYIYPHAARPLAGLMASRGLAPALPGWAAAGLSLLTVLLAWSGLPWPALALFILSGVALASASRLAELRMAELPHRRVVVAIRGLAALFGLALLAGALVAASAQWGWWLLAAAAVVAAASLRLLDQLWLREGRQTPVWWPDLDGLAWAMLAGAAAGGWGAALIAVPAYALAGTAHALLGLAGPLPVRFRAP